MQNYSWWEFRKSDFFLVGIFPQKRKEGWAGGWVFYSRWKRTERILFYSRFEFDTILTTLLGGWWVSADELITSTANGGARARLALVQRAHGKERGRARRSCVAHLGTRSSARPHHGSHRWLYCEKIGSQHRARACYFSIAAWLDPRAQVRRAAAPRRGTRRSLLVERHCCQPCCQTLSGSYVKDTNWVH